MNLDAFIGTSKYFKWKEALWLNSIQVYHIPSPEEIRNIEKLCARLDKVRELVKVPLLVNCWIRPKSVNCTDPKYQGFDYNALVKGAKNSAHITGEAVDLHPSGLSVDQVQNLIRAHMDKLELAGEQNGAAVKRNWLHLQCRPLPKGDPWRFFLP